MGQTHDELVESAPADDDEELISCGNCTRTLDDDSDGHTVNDETWCERCYDEFSRVCYSCEESFHYDVISYDNRDDAYCDECRDHGEGYWDDAYDDENIFSHDEDVLQRCEVSPLAPGALYFGVEIELNTRREYDRGQAAEGFNARFGALGIVKHDGSIGTGSSGLEFVSVPLSLVGTTTYIRDFLSTESIMQHVFADATCGMHVHLSRSALSAYTLVRMLRFMNHPDNTPFMQSLAGRDITASSWATIQPHLSSPSLLKTLVVHDPFRNGAKARTAYYPLRYQALNLSNPYTVEVRIFASTTDRERACANVEACAALAAFCRPASRSYVEAGRPEAFGRFVEANRRVYPHLTALLSSLSLAKAA